MADLLLELFSEEIPAIMQNKACEDLNNIVTNALVEAGLTYKSSKSLSTPRRLCLMIEGLINKSPDTREERKGPFSFLTRVWAFINQAFDHQT